MDFISLSRPDDDSHFLLILWGCYKHVWGHVSERSSRSETQSLFFPPLLLHSLLTCFSHKCSQKSIPTEQQVPEAISKGFHRAETLHRSRDLFTIKQSGTPAEMQEPALTCLPQNRKSLLLAILFVRRISHKSYSFSPKLPIWLCLWF